MDVPNRVAKIPAVAVYSSVDREKLALKVEEAVERTGIPDKQIYRAIHAGELRAKKLGNSWYIPVAALIAWLNNEQSTMSKSTIASKSPPRSREATVKGGPQIDAK